MNNELHNMDDLFDESIGKSLRQLGDTFAKTTADCKKMDELAQKMQINKPERLTDPYAFLGKRSFRRAASSQNNEEEKNYDSEMAQAAREGKGINEEIKKKMAADKLMANQNKRSE